MNLPRMIIIPRHTIWTAFFEGALFGAGAALGVLFLVELAKRLP